MAASVAFLVALEVSGVNTLRRFGFFASVWHRALIAVFRVVAVVYLPAKAAGAVKPGPGTDEDACSEPFWPVVAGGRAAVGGCVVVAIGTFGSDANIDTD